ncbi:MAG: hypothetical protein M3O67_05360 [Bacteroidota bacterium]|nr:hypothetical protein [Bacteroidota bacterium]
MKASTINELKNELKEISQPETVELCLRLARFKKENKELLTYLLFEAHDEPGYIKNVKKTIDDQFEEINHTSLYFVKKSLRKILRTINKHIRYTGSKLAETELLIYFCQKIKELKIPVHKNKALANLYENQLKKIKLVVEGLHEDLQYDYLKEVDLLQD